MSVDNSELKDPGGQEGGIQLTLCGYGGLLEDGPYELFVLENLDFALRIRAKNSMRTAEPMVR